MTHLSFACADCLEDAGGRQLQHGIAWYLECCPACGKRRCVTDTRNFGNPPLTPCVLDVISPPERKET